MSGSAAAAFVPGDADLVAIGPLVRRRVSASTRQRWAGAAIVPMVAVTVGLALTSEHSTAVGRRPVLGLDDRGVDGGRPLLVAAPSAQPVRSAVGRLRRSGSW